MLHEGVSSSDGDFNNGRFGTLATVSDCRDAIKAILENELVRRELESYLFDIKAVEERDAGGAFFEEVKDTLTSVLDATESYFDKYSRNWSFTSVLSHEGYLPLYGLPVRNTYLIHEDPVFGDNEGDWPIRKGIIDRGEDIALSEFSPKNSIVKDKNVITSVGVAWPYSLQISFNRSQIRYGDPKLARNISCCDNCGAIVFEHMDQCIKCGAASEDIRFYQGWRPGAYVADIHSSERYIGSLDNVPAKIRFHASEQESIETAQRDHSRNYELKGFQGKLLKVNDNNGAGYRFHEVNGTRVMNGVYVNEEQINNFLSTRDWAGIEVDNPTSDVALYTEMVTDILTVNLSTLPSEESLLGCTEGFSSVKTKAAWDSLAELVSRQIAVVEDFEPDEISVGRVFVNYSVEDDTIAGWGIYIADNLDNGAGYASEYGTSGKFNQLIDGIKDSMVESYLLAGDHPLTCTTSCYHCLRNYFNRNDHKNLDWRLALDLLELLDGRDINDRFEALWWGSYLENTLPKKLAGILGTDIHVREDSDFGLFYTDHANIALYPTHPLVHIEHLNFLDLKSRFMDKVGAINGGLLDVFSFERSPLSAIQAAQKE